MTPWTNDYAIGHLAAAVAWYLKTDDRKGLEADYKQFLASPVCTRELRETLPKVVRR